MSDTKYNISVLMEIVYSLSGPRSIPIKPNNIY